MSQNKTIVPGVNYDNSGSNEYEEAIYGNLYSRSSNTDDNRTYIAGQPAKVSNGNEATATHDQGFGGIGMPYNRQRHIAMQERMVVGCLFSISKSLLGEIYPLYLGRNIIGSSSGCDICLKEKTISPEHAILYIRKEERPSSYNITLTDYNSEYGTAVNGNDGRYETLAIKENDVITVGRHYKLLIKTFNSEEAGLDEDTDFEEIDIQDNINTQNIYNNSAPPAVSNDFYTPTRNDEESTRTVIY